MVDVECSLSGGPVVNMPPSLVAAPKVVGVLKSVTTHSYAAPLSPLPPYSPSARLNSAYEDVVPDTQTSLRIASNKAPPIPDSLMSPPRTDLPQFQPPTTPPARPRPFMHESPAPLRLLSPDSQSSASAPTHLSRQRARPPSMPGSPQSITATSNSEALLVAQFPMTVGVPVVAAADVMPRFDDAGLPLPAVPSGDDSQLPMPFGAPFQLSIPTYAGADDPYSLLPTAPNAQPPSTSTAALAAAAGSSATLPHAVVTTMSDMAPVAAGAPPDLALAVDATSAASDMAAAAAATPPALPHAGTTPSAASASETFGSISTATRRGRRGNTVDVPSIRRDKTAARKRHLGPAPSTGDVDDKKGDELAQVILLPRLSFTRPCAPVLTHC